MDDIATEVLEIGGRVGSEDWMVAGDSGKVTLRPFAAVGEESYWVHHNVEA